MACQNPYFEWQEKWFAALVANPSVTEDDFNGKAAFDAFIREHPPTDEDWFLVAWAAGDIISRCGSQ